ncbi:MBL fold metallo-hydrolase [Rhodoplanes sp. Z2-YC6860]|uniref:MBL fold metallo-hydrolase n=1 Tax=Rhodoplanes sp. Z2-YC6860 TaxID=674703 RepID=UPI0008360446|nr:MBL fold metallo-hydrolase [Rhodoplanes sp. Z2-YC6860]
MNAGPLPTITVGDFSVAAVSDGVLYSTSDVILGIDKAESERLTGVKQGERLPLDVNCFLIRHGDRLMLSDAGSGLDMQPTLGTLPQNLRSIGVAPEKIDTVLLTHFHPDHSLGLVDREGRPVFPNAEIIAHEVEVAFWLDREPRPDDSERVQRGTRQQRQVMAPYRDRIRRIKDGEVLPGITATMRPGHTPGHTNYLIQSKGERLLIWGDIVHLAAVQLVRPDATLVFDVDPDVARATRQAVLEWVAAEKVIVAGAHLPAPGFCRLSRDGSRFVIEAA